MVLLLLGLLVLSLYWLLVVFYSRKHIEKDLKYMHVEHGRHFDVGRIGQVENDKIMVLFPGNPGIVEFYICFMQKLYQELKVCVYIVGHAGFGQSKLMKNGKPVVYDLEQQVKLKVDFVNALLQEYPNASISLIGHSVGSYMVLEVLKRIGTDRVNGCSLLAPTIIDMIHSANGRFFNYILKHYDAGSVAMKFLLAVIPKQVWNALLRIVAYIKFQDNHMEKESFVLAVLKLLDPHVIRNMMFLGLDELKLIKHLKWTELQHFPFLFVFAHQDAWLSPSIENAIQNYFTTSKFIIKRIPHAFSIEKNGSSKMALQVIQYEKSF